MRVTFDPVKFGLVIAAIICASTGHLTAGVILAALAVVLGIEIEL